MKINRPLSPHIQIYKWQITSLMSIAHRITGIILIPALMLLIAWLGCIAMGQSCYDDFIMICSHPICPAILIGFIFCFLFYSFNNIRHIFWDFGKGFELRDAKHWAWVIIYLSFLATAVIGTVLFIILKG